MLSTIVYIFPISIIFSFILGVLITIKVTKPYRTEKYYKNIHEKHINIKTWLKSELKKAKKSKSNIDEKKVMLIELIISKLS